MTEQGKENFNYCKSRAIHYYLNKSYENAKVFIDIAFAKDKLDEQVIEYKNKIYRQLQKRKWIRFQSDGHGT